MKTGGILTVVTVHSHKCHNGQQNTCTLECHRLFWVFEELYSHNVRRQLTGIGDSRKVFCQCCEQSSNVLRERGTINENITYLFVYGHFLITPATNWYAVPGKCFVRSCSAVLSKKNMRCSMTFIFGRGIGRLGYTYTFHFLQAITTISSGR